MKGCCEADGTQDELYVRYVSADSDDVFSRLVLQGGKKFKKWGRKIAFETQLKSSRPRNEKTNRQTEHAACLYRLCANAETLKIAPPAANPPGIRIYISIHMYIHTRTHTCRVRCLPPAVGR